MQYTYGTWSSTSMPSQTEEWQSFWDICKKRFSTQWTNIKNYKFLLVKCMQWYVQNGPVIILVLIWFKLIQFSRRYVTKNFFYVFVPSNHKFVLPATCVQSWSFYSSPTASKLKARDRRMDRQMYTVQQIMQSPRKGHILECYITIHLPFWNCLSFWPSAA